MPLTLTFRHPSAAPLEVDSIRIESVRSQSLDEVLRTPVHRGNRSLPFGDFFEASGSACDDETIVWQGDLRKVKRIGAGLSRGRVIVEGDAGMHLGAEMTGGDVEVHGDVGDWAGAQMQGGTIHIRGNAGNLVGAAYRGSRKGMTGGEILIDGNAGHELGRAMRRGIIAVGGDVGDFVGTNMIAGTVYVCGNCGIRHGAGMKRGTIALLGPNAPELLPTFRYACDMEPMFLGLYVRRVSALGWRSASGQPLTPVRRYCGDILEVGKGEILTRRL